MAVAHASAPGAPAAGRAAIALQPIYHLRQHVAGGARRGDPRAISAWLRDSRCGQAAAAPGCPARPAPPPAPGTSRAGWRGSRCAGGRAFRAPPGPPRATRALLDALLHTVLVAVSARRCKRSASVGYAMARMTQPWRPSERYPDPAVQVLDPSFARYRIAARRRRAPVYRLPLGRGAGLVRRCPLRAVERHPERPHPALGRGDGGHVRCSGAPANNANGNTRDRQGRLVTCEHRSRRVTRTEYDGSITPCWPSQLSGQAASTPRTTSW